MGKDAECCGTCRIETPLVAGRAHIGISWSDRGSHHALVPTGAEVRGRRGKGNHIMIDSDVLGRRQCRFVFEDVVVEDAGSARGTFLDGTRIDSTAVRNGSQVHIGNHVHRVCSTRSR